MTCYKISNINEKQLIDDFNKDFHICVFTKRLTAIEEEAHSRILNIFFKEIGKEFIFEYINYMYREIINNAIKANIKRLYFDKNKIDINNEKSYSDGMARFKTNYINNYSSFQDTLEQSAFYVKTTFKLNEDSFTINVENNTPIVDEEKEIIRLKMINAREFNSIEDAIEMVSENKEGAGLGIIISVLMLKKLGLSEKNYVIKPMADKTQAELTIPLSLVTIEQKNILNNYIISEIKEIPDFPEHIKNIQEQLKDPMVNFKTLSLKIIKDVSLTGKIIKFSNSAIFSTGKTTSNLTDAIKIIGINGIKNIVFSYGMESVINQRYKGKKLQEIFDYSELVARISFHLAKNITSKDILENIYVGGLLHNIGMLVLMGINEELLVKINELCHQKNIPIRIIEELTNGQNHELIGFELAKKWNFPDELTDVICNHHTPAASTSKDPTMINTIYLADIIALWLFFGISTPFGSVDENVKKMFNLSDELHYNKLITDLQEATV